MVKFRHSILDCFIGTFSLFLSILFLSSCIKEDLGKCSQYLTFDVRVLDTDNKDITVNGDVHDGLMFIFDEKGRKLFKFVMSNQDIISRVRKDIPRHVASDLQFVFYGNPSAAMLSSLKDVNSLSDLKFQLESNRGIAEEAPDLFYGSLRHHAIYGNVSDVKNLTVDVRRITSMVHVRVVGLRHFIENKLTLKPGTYNPSLVTIDLGPTPDTYCELGKLCGSDVWYHPLFGLNGDGSELISDRPYRIYPTMSDAPLKLRIYYDGKPCFTADRTLDGKTLFVPVVGKTLNILLVLRSDLEIKVEVSDWDVVYQFVEF